MGNVSNKEIEKDQNCKRTINIYPKTKSNKMMSSESDDSLDSKNRPSVDYDSDEEYIDHCDISYIDTPKSLFDVKVQEIKKIKHNVYELDSGYEIEPPDGYLIAICPHPRLSKYGLRMSSKSVINNRQECKITIESSSDSCILPKIDTTVAYLTLIKTFPFNVDVLNDDVEYYDVSKIFTSSE